MTKNQVIAAQREEIARLGRRALRAEGQLADRLRREEDTWDAADRLKASLDDQTARYLAEKQKADAKVATLRTLVLALLDISGGDAVFTDEELLAHASHKLHHARDGITGINTFTVAPQSATESTREFL